MISCLFICGSVCCLMHCFPCCGCYVIRAFKAAVPCFTFKKNVLLFWCMWRLWDDELKYTVKNFSGCVKRYFLGASTFPLHKYSPSPTLILETLFRNYYVIRKFPISSHSWLKRLTIPRVSYYNISDYVKTFFNELTWHVTSIRDMKNWIFRLSFIACRT